MKNQNLLLTFAFAICLSFMYSCSGGGSTSAPATMAMVDLSTNNIPVSFEAPEGAEIKKGLMDGEAEGERLFNVEVKKGHFKVDVTMWDAEYANTAAELVAEDKEIATEEDGFAIVKEEANGYIYNTDLGYDFYYVLPKGNRIIEFTTALYFGEYTLAEVETMYNSVKAAK